MSMPCGDATNIGHLFGVGVGPGDPDLMTVKARAVLQASPVVAHFAARSRRGNAWTIIESFVTCSQIVLRLEYPLTTETVQPGVYENSISDFYDRSAALIAGQLDCGRDVAVVCEGDPFFYGSYMYIHQRLADKYPTTVIPGVTSFSAATAAAGVPLVSMNETLTVLPGVLPPEQLKDVLSNVDAAVVMKVGRHLGEVRDAARAVGLAERSLYVERASCVDERILPVTETEGVDAPYFSLVLIPGVGLDARRRAAE